MIWARGWSGLPSHISIPNTCTFPYPGRWRRKALETCLSLIPPSSAPELGAQIRKVTPARLILHGGGDGRARLLRRRRVGDQRSDKHKRHRSGRLGRRVYRRARHAGHLRDHTGVIINTIARVGMCSYDDSLAGKRLSVFGRWRPGYGWQIFPALPWTGRVLSTSPMRPTTSSASRGRCNENVRT
jgi:hypothetical protein